MNHKNLKVAVSLLSLSAVLFLLTVSYLMPSGWSVASGVVGAVSLALVLVGGTYLADGAQFLFAMIVLFSGVMVKVFFLLIFYLVGSLVELDLGVLTLYFFGFYSTFLIVAAIALFMKFQFSSARGDRVFG